MCNNNLLLFVHYIFFLYSVINPIQFLLFLIMSFPRVCFNSHYNLWFYFDLLSNYDWNSCFSMFVFPTPLKKCTWLPSSSFPFPYIFFWKSIAMLISAAVNTSLDCKTSILLVIPWMLQHIKIIFLIRLPCRFFKVSPKLFFSDLLAVRKELVRCKKPKLYR